MAGPAACFKLLLTNGFFIGPRENGGSTN